MAISQKLVKTITKIMEVDAATAVGDLVYQSTANTNKAIKVVDNNSLGPVMGRVTYKADSTTAIILLHGITDVGVLNPGTILVSTGGGFTDTKPGTNYLQVLGNSFGDGKMYFNPQLRRIKQS